LFQKETIFLSIEENIDEIRRNVPDGVTLIAVSKTRTLEEISTAYDKGIRDFGENKVQEFVEKSENLPGDIKWHLIGHLQRNKVKYVAGKVFLIHSLDSVRLLEELEKQYSRLDRKVQTLIQLNIGRETSKTGVMVDELETLINAVENCKYVEVVGLMVIIPKGDEESSRRYFKETKVLWEELKIKEYKNISMTYLSMGMTNDYRVAISEGANMIRIGEGIFGKRVYNNI
jgi:PLP dependent protein